MPMQDKYREWISLKDTGDQDNMVEGGYCTVFEIMGFGMSYGTGQLSYRRVGPSFPNNTNPDLVQSMAIAIPQKPIVHHIFTLERITDDVVEELRTRGVEIKFENNPVVK